MKDLRNMTKSQVIEALEAIGEKAFRGKQVFEWVMQKVYLTLIR